MGTDEFEVLYPKLMVLLTPPCTKLLADHIEDGIVKALWIVTSQYFPPPELLFILLAQWIRFIFPFSNALLSQFYSFTVQEFSTAFKTLVLENAVQSTLVTQESIQRCEHCTKTVWFVLSSILFAKLGKEALQDTI